MKKIVLTSILIVGLHSVFAQTNPVILNWLQNTTGIMGRHYVKNNSTPIVDVAAIVPIAIVINPTSPTSFFM